MLAETTGRFAALDLLHDTHSRQRGGHAVYEESSDRMCVVGQAIGGAERELRQLQAAPGVNQEKLRKIEHRLRALRAAIETGWRMVGDAQKILFAPAPKPKPASGTEEEPPPPRPFYWGGP